MPALCTGIGKVPAGAKAAGGGRIPAPTERYVAAVWGRAGVKVPVTSRTTLRRLYSSLTGAMLLVSGSIALPLGCTGVPSDSNNGDGDNTNGNGTGTTRIINFSTNFSVSQLDPPISVLYNVEGEPDLISGFFRPVADNSADPEPLGDPVITDIGLEPGMNHFSFVPAVAGIGFFRVGLVMLDAAQESTVESSAVVRVEGPPDPAFFQPIEAITEVVQGEEVPVTFDAGDPEGEVQWRLFLLASADSRESSPDQLGTALDVGQGNVGVFSVATAALSPGDYQLGLSATDTGLSISATVTAGQTYRIVTVLGPIIRVMAP